MNFRKKKKKKRGQKKFFLGQRKFFTSIDSLKLWWKAHKNFGGVMPGFGTWAIILEIIVLDYKFIFYFFTIFFLCLKKWYCTFSISCPQSHIAPKLTFPPTNNFAPNSTWTAFLWVASPPCSHWATDCLLRKHQF